MDFDSKIGKLQRLIAESIAGISRRNAILNEMRITPGDKIIDVGFGAGHLLTHLAKQLEHQIKFMDLTPIKTNWIMLENDARIFKMSVLSKKMPTRAI